MTDPNPSAQTASEEQASLYILDLLDAAERQAFEQRLRRDADLRGLVHGFQSALEAEVFAEPAPAAPARVWGKILERTRMDGAQVLMFPESLRRWMPRLAAMAACLALGAFLQSLSNPGGGWTAQVRRMTGSSPAFPGAPSTADRSVSAGVVLPAADELVPPGQNPLGSGPGRPAPSPDADAPSTGDRDEALLAENAALQGKVRGLTAQVAELSQQVQQWSLIPSGVSRLHVFPLGQPGFAALFPAAGPDGVGRTNSLAESLARLAGERMAAVLGGPTGTGSLPEVASFRQAGAANPPPGSGLLAAVEPVGKVALVPAQPGSPESAVASAGGPAAGLNSGLNSAVVSGAVAGSGPGLASVAMADPSAGRGGSTAQPPVNPPAPIVFSAPDSGIHAVAVPTAPPGGQYQLWNRGADGTVSSLGVLTPSGSPVSVVTFERGSVDGLFMSLEPVGGSFQPTGPVVGSPQTPGINPVLPGLGKP